MSNTIEINDGNRSEYGGDCAVMDTVPKINPLTGKPMARPTRENVKGSGFFTLLGGDIIRKDDPSAEFNFTYWEDNKSAISMLHSITLKAQKGFASCEPSDWIIRPELREFLIADGSEIVVAGGSANYRFVLMYRTKARYEQEMELERKHLRHIDNGGKDELSSRLSNMAGNSGFETFVEQTTETIVEGVSQGAQKQRK